MADLQLRFHNLRSGYFLLILNRRTSWISQQLMFRASSRRTALWTMMIEVLRFSRNQGKLCDLQQSMFVLVFQFSLVFTLWQSGIKSV